MRMSLYDAHPQHQFFTYDVFVDGVKVCQVQAINQAHAVWLAKSNDHFKKAVEKFANKTYYVSACRANNS